MIIQSSNKPIKIKFPQDFDVTTFKQLRVTLWQDDEMLKLWTLEDVEIEENTVIAKLTQEETIEFLDKRCVLEIKWLNEEDVTEFAQQVSLIITDRNDKEVMNNE